MCRKVREEGQGWGLTEEGWWCEKVERECYGGRRGLEKGEKAAQREMEIRTDGRQRPTQHRE